MTGIDQVSQDIFKPIPVFSSLNQDGYKLVWSEEFNKNGTPDPANWRYENGFVRNKEAQWYEEDNAFCENGMLVIEARKETRPNPRYEANSKEWRKNRQNIEYTSSSINTRGKHELEKLVNKDGSGINPFNQPHYMLLNLAMGGMNGGDLGDTKFPNRFEVDYVRVYHK